MASRYPRTATNEASRSRYTNISVTTSGFESEESFDKADPLKILDFVEPLFCWVVCSVRKRGVVASVAPSTSLR
jgi:hypothetical protein